MNGAGFTSDCFSQPASANLALQRALKGREEQIATIPSVPVIWKSVLEELNQPADRIDLSRVADIIGRDTSLAAQCLRMANSPLFSRGPSTDSLRTAVRTLGFNRTRDIAVSCGLMRLLPHSLGPLNPLVFWQHSLACAIVARKLARAVGFGDPDQAYLAGLMHDIGYIVNMVVFPDETGRALKLGQQEKRFAGEIEYRDFGFTHCQTGELLARRWHLSDALVEVILCHHNPPAAVISPAIVSIVSIADQLCRGSDLGLGYAENPIPPEKLDADWQGLTEKCPFAADISWREFFSESGTYMDEIKKLVETMYRQG